MNVGDAILAGLNGYKADAMSRAEAVLMISEAIMNQCYQCSARQEDNGEAAGENKLVEGTAWED